MLGSPIDLRVIVFKLQHDADWLEIVPNIFFTLLIGYTILERLQDQTL